MSAKAITSIRFVSRAEVASDLSRSQDKDFLIEMMEEYYREAVQGGFTHEQAQEYAVLMVGQPRTKTS